MSVLEPATRRRVHAQTPGTFLFDSSDRSVVEDVALCADVTPGRRRGDRRDRGKATVNRESA